MIAPSRPTHATKSLSADRLVVSPRERFSSGTRLAVLRPSHDVRDD